MVDLLLLALLLYAFFKCTQSISDGGSQDLDMDGRMRSKTRRKPGQTQAKRGKNQGKKRGKFSRSSKDTDARQGFSRSKKIQGKDRRKAEKSPRGKRGQKSGQKSRAPKGRGPKSGKASPMLIGSPPGPTPEPDPSWSEGKPGLQMTVDRLSNRTVEVDSTKTVTIMPVMVNRQKEDKFVVKPTNPDEQDEETMSGIEEERSFAELRGTGGEKLSHYVRERPYNPDFPTSLEGFGYRFVDGKLVNIETRGPFVFEAIPGDRDYNQRRYEAIGEIITDIVYDLLENQAGLQRIPVPNDSSRMLSSFIFASDGALSNREKLMILIHGSGVVRAGQWSRRLIMNDCLTSGTQLPFIVRALQEGYGVVVLNTNRNNVIMNNTVHIIPGSSSAEWHGCTVWRDYILASPAKRIDIVAHSYGGKVTVEMMKLFFEDFRRRVHKIAFTDSVHSLAGLDRVAYRWITGHALNWVSSDTPLNTVMHTVGDVPRVSAGTTKHEETSWHAFNSVFAYFNDTTT